MAFFQMNFFSPTLCFNTDINVVVPTPNSDEILNHKSSDYFHPGARFQVLYLLHGAYGDYSDWMRLTSIEKYAQNHKLAVVMPSASNSFYQDMYRGSRYFTYLTEELPGLVRSIFPVSTRRENTFVAGLSMGGYGALHLAFAKPEMYGACASLSGAIDMVGCMRDNLAGTVAGPFRWPAIFRNPEEVDGSDADLFALAKKRMAEGRALPPVYQTVGTEDFLYQSNLGARKKLEEIGVQVTYAEHHGMHDWDFWDAHIQDVLDWLPLANDAVND